MNTQTKIYIAIALVFAAVLIGAAAWSDHRVSQAERSVADAKKAAADSQQAAAKLEVEAAEFKQKIGYLETRLNEITTLSRKQDEQLEKQITNTRNARADVERIRRTRPAAADRDELCRRLADVGYPCEK